MECGISRTFNMYKRDRDREKDVKNDRCSSLLSEGV